MAKFALGSFQSAFGTAAKHTSNGPDNVEDCCYRALRTADLSTGSKLQYIRTNLFVGHH
jgi:hypothetical protein